MNAYREPALPSSLDLEDARAFFAARSEFGDAEAGGDEAKRAFFDKYGFADEAHWLAASARAIERFATGPDGAAKIATAISASIGERIAATLALASSNLPAPSAEALAPIEGVGLESYAELKARLEVASTRAARQVALAKAGLDETTWATIDAEWQERMKPGAASAVALGTRFAALSVAAHLAGL